MPIGSSIFLDALCLDSKENMQTLLIGFEKLPKDVRLRSTRQKIEIMEEEDLGPRFKEVQSMHFELFVAMDSASKKWSGTFLKHTSVVRLLVSQKHSYAQGQRDPLDDRCHSQLSGSNC